MHLLCVRPSSGCQEERHVPGARRGPGPGPHAPHPNLRSSSASARAPVTLSSTAFSGSLGPRLRAGPLLHPEAHSPPCARCPKPFAHRHPPPRRRPPSHVPLRPPFLTGPSLMLNPSHRQPPFLAQVGGANPAPAGRRPPAPLLSWPERGGLTRTTSGVAAAPHAHAKTNTPESTADGQNRVPPRPRPAISRGHRFQLPSLPSPTLPWGLGPGTPHLGGTRPVAGVRLRRPATLQTRQALSKYF